MGGQKTAGYVLTGIGITLMVLSGMFTYTTNPIGSIFFYIGIFMLLIGVIVRMTAKSEY